MGGDAAAWHVSGWLEPLDTRLAIIGVGLWGFGFQSLCRPDARLDIIQVNKRWRGRGDRMGWIGEFKIRRILIVSIVSRCGRFVLRHLLCHFLLLLILPAHTKAIHNKSDKKEIRQSRSIARSL